MSDIYSAGTSGGNTDWVAEEDRRKRRRRRNRADQPLDPNSPDYPGPQPGISAPPIPNVDITTPVDLSGAPTSQGGGRISTDPEVYKSQIREKTLNPFPGSFSSTLPGMGKNPYSMPAFATSPILIANQLLANKYGLPAGSNVAGAMATYFNPQEKYLGLGAGQMPKNNADWINLGASLMQGLQGNGQQLDPKSMMTSAVQAVMEEVQAMSAGGKGAGDTFTGPLAELAHEEPGQALNDFTGLIAGMLKGTMPDEEISGYMNFLKRMGQQFLQEFYTTADAAQAEAQGISFISYLVKRLGPSLGF